MTSSRYYPILGTLLSPALVATLAGLETASLELNAHLRVQPAHCVYDFLFSLGFFDHALPSTLQASALCQEDKYSIQQKAIEFQTANETSTARLRSFLGQMLRGCVRSSI